MNERTHPGEGPGVDGPQARAGGTIRSACDTTGRADRPRPEHRCDGGTAPPGLFDSTPDPTLRYAAGDDAPTVTDVNAAYAEAFGVSSDVTGSLEARLRSDLERAEPGEGFARVDDVVDLVESATAGTRTRAVVRANTSTGERDYLARVVPFAAVGDGHDDEPDGYLVLTDVSAQLERTRELVEQRDRLDEFASIVSHDLRNPLEVAKIQLEVALERGDDVHYEKVRDAHDRMERIIDDVLTLARQGAIIDEVDVVSLSTVASDAWDSVSTTDATMIVESAVAIEADAERLQELFENLFRNAYEHAGPTVAVTVGPTVDGFYVADDGPGIPEEVRQEVFEGGFSTDVDGTGLGLLIVDRIADAHGWSVSVGTSEDGGARFDFSDVAVVD